MSDTNQTPKRRRGPSRAFTPSTPRTSNKNVASTPKKTETLSEKNEKLLNFLCKKSIGIQYPMARGAIFDEYKRENQLTSSKNALIDSFRRTLAPKIHRLEGFDDETKARLLYATGTPVDPAFLKKLQKSAVVEVDVHQRIVKFESENLKLSGRHKTMAGVPRSQRGRNDTTFSPPPPPPPAAYDDLEMLGDQSIMCAPMQIIKTEPPEEAGQELVPHVAFPVYAPPPMHPAVVYPGFMMAGMGNFFNSLTGMIQSQTQLINDMARAPISISTPSQVSDTQTASVLEFLKHIQQWILKSDRIQLGDIHHKIVMSLQNLAGRAKRIEASRVKMALEAAFSICSGSIGSGAQCVNLKEFATMLLMYASSQQMYGFCVEFKKKIDKIDAQTLVPIDKVRIALEALVGIVLE